MAEISMNEQGVSSAQGRNIGTLTSYAGAVLSLALIVGVGVWSYKLLARDVSGVPVVRAATGEPMRVAPKNPGGSNAAHQGLSVNKVMAEGAAEKPADRLVLAPKPVELDEEDAPMASVEVAQPTASREQRETSDETADSDTLTPQMVSIQALAEEIASGAKPLDTPAQSDAVSEATTVTAAPALEVKPAVKDENGDAVGEAPSKDEVKQAGAFKVNGFGRSLRPVLRPAAFKTDTASGSAEKVAETEPAEVPAGTRLVQLGAFDDAEVARGEWTRLSDRFEDYMDGKTRVVQRAKSGGRVFYRLRAMGFADLSDARRFCAALVAEKADCIPVVAK